MATRPNSGEKLHAGLTEIAFKMLIIDGNCAEVKDIINRLSESYNLSRRQVRQLASEFVLKRDFTDEPTVAELEQRLTTIGDDASE